MVKRTKSVRVQMSIETEKELKLLAEKYDCFYNEDLSLSMLFAKIGRKELTIQPQELLIKPIGFDNYVDSDLDLLILTMNCPFNVNGIVARVTEKIAEKEGNIFRINARHQSNNLGVLKLHLSLGKYEQENLVKMLDSIYNITLEDIRKFNYYEKLIAADDLLRQHQLSNTTNIEKATDAIREVLHRNVIINISCIFGIRVTSINKPGTLRKITEKIAVNKVLVSSIVQNFDNQNQKDVVRIFLEIKIPENQLNLLNLLSKEKQSKKNIEKVKKTIKEEQYKKINDEIGKIQKIMNELESDKELKVERLNIYDLDALKHSGFESEDI
jgi:predicted regulator of amino acid metabolism with ACT domain